MIGSDDIQWVKNRRPSVAPLDEEGKGRERASLMLYAERSSRLGFVESPRRWWPQPWRLWRSGSSEQRPVFRMPAGTASSLVSAWARPTRRRCSSSPRALLRPLLTGDARPWLLGLATNLIRNHLRHCDRGERALRRLAMGNEGDHADAAVGRVEATLLGPDLASALDGIAEDGRDALLLMAWNDLSYQEVADALDVPIGTVRSRISRARLRLRARLADLGYTREEPQREPTQHR